MNASMRITITVARRNAQALAQTAREIQNINTAAAGTKGALGGVGTGLAGAAGQAGNAAQKVGLMQRVMDATNTHLVRFGKNLQWIGRQLQYNFTLPIVAAFTLAGIWENRNEAAFTRLRKVYGNGLQTEAVTEDLTQLRKIFELLSDEYGVQQDEVIALGAQWAEAGAQGVTLAKGVKLTLDAMILGDLEAADAASQLITVMQAYHLTTTELTTALGYLNQIENETAVGFGDLITVVQSAGGSAVVAGVDIRHLGAMAASLVPAFGDAATAGTGLRSMITQIMAASNPVVEAFHKIGIQVETLDWGTRNFTQRLEVLSASYAGLTQNQKLAFAAQVVGVRQASRLLGLLEDIADANGRYQTALRATGGDTGDAAAAQAQMNREIGIFLASSPQAWKILTTQIQNDMARVITPLIPLMQRLLSYVVKAVDAFGRLNPQVQQLVLVGLLALAVLGPMARYIGAIAQLAGILKAGVVFLTGAFEALGTAVLAVGEALVGPFAAALGIGTGPLLLIIAALAAAAVAFYFFHDQIISAVKGVVEAVAQHLPQAFINGLTAVVRIVKQAAMAVYSWFSWMNPFATHSPSLVSQVTDGVDAIVDEYQRLDNATSSLVTAKQRMEDFTAATARARAELAAQDRAEQRKKIVNAAPSSGGAFDALVANIADMKAQLPGLQSLIDQQQAAVDQWSTALDDANTALDKQTGLLDMLKDTAGDYQQQLSDAQTRLQDLFSTPLQGMREMDELIFQNTIDQKKLRLEMLRMEDAGQSIQDIRDQLAGLQGDLEQLLGMREGLRLQGAGSDILGPLDEQIAKLRAQQTALTNAGSPYEELQKQLDALQHAGEELDLQRDLQFDPLTHQIDLLSQSVAEVPFDQLYQQIVDQQGVVKQLTQQWEAAEKAVADQQSAVDIATAHRDEIKQAYDAAKESLDNYTQSYNDLKDAISDAEAAIQDLITAQQNADAGGAGGGAGDGGIPGDFADAAGTGGLENEMGSLQDLFDQWSADMQSMFGNFDIFQPLMDQWNNLVGWFGDHVPDLGNVFSGNIGGIDFPSLFSNIEVPHELEGTTSRIGQIFGDLRGDIMDAVNFIRPRFGGFVDFMVTRARDFYNGVKPYVEEFRDLWEPAKEAVRNLSIVLGIYLMAMYTYIKLFITLVGAIWYAFWPAIRNVVVVLFNGMVSTVQNALMLIHGIIQMILGLISLRFDVFGRGLVEVVHAIFNQLVSLVEVPMQLIWAVISGILERVVGLFPVSWAQISAATSAAWAEIKSLLDTALGIFLLQITVPLDAVETAFRTVWGVIPGIVSAAWELIKTVTSTIAGIFTAQITIPVNAIKTAFETVWNALPGIVGGAWDLVKAVFSDLGTFLTDSVQKPWETLRDNLSGIADELGGMFNGIFDGVSGMWSGAINQGIDVINGFIHGANTILSHFHLPTIGDIARTDSGPARGPHGTSGPVSGGSGFGAHMAADGGVFSRATMIVGEGSDVYPEWVIPTDPQHRGRAMSLFDSLSNALGIRQMALGGINPLGSIGGAFGNIVGGIGDVLGEARHAAVRTALAGPNALANRLIDALPDSPFPADLAKGLARYVKNELYDWAVGYKSGSAVLPTDQFAYLHQGERVLNAQQATRYVPGQDAGNNGGGRVMNFYGNLVFPNVKDGSDAEDFIRTLEAIS